MDTRARTGWRVLASLVLVLLVGCAALKPTSRTTSAGRGFESGFLTGYSSLEPTETGSWRRVYRDPAVSFTDYDKLLFDRITIWRDVDDTEPVESVDFQRVADAHVGKP